MIRLPMADFSAGLMSGKLAGRYDLEAYLKACAELENWVPIPQGGVTYRPGSTYKTTTRNSAKARLLSWTCGPSTAFIVEIGHESGTGYLRVFQEVAGTFTQLVEFVNGSGGAVVPWSTDAMVAETHFAMDSSAFYLVNRNYAPRKLAWLGGTTFSFGTHTITGNTATAWAALTAYTSDDYCSNAGKIYRCTTPGTSAASGGPITMDPDITDGTVHWTYLGDGLPFQSTGNYPGAIAALNARLIFAASTNEPQAIWASRPFQPGNFTYFESKAFTFRQLMDKAEWADPDVPETEEVTEIRDITTSGNAFKIELRSEENEYILGMATQRDLIVFTTTSEWTLPRDITAINPRAEVQSRHGSTRIQPRTMGGFAYFASSPKTIRAAQYVYGSDTYEAADITMLSEACAAGILSWEFTLHPDPSLYVVLADGTMAILTRNRLSGAATWYAHSPAVGGGTEAIESVAAITGTDGDDDVYLIVKRGSSRFIEKMDRLFSGLHLDSAITATAAGGAISGLSHLNGMAVSAVQGDIVYTGTVAAGSVSPLSAEGDAIPNGACRVGLAFTATLRTMRLPEPSQEGSVIGLPRRLGRVGVSVYDTLSFKIGTKIADLTPKTYSAATTEEANIDITSENTMDVWVFIVQDTPLKATILAIAPEIVTLGDQGGA